MTKSIMQSIHDRIMFFVVILQTAFFVLFETATWGRYFFLALMVASYVVMIIDGKGSLYLETGLFIGHILGFICITFFSSIWARNAGEPLEKTITLVEIGLCVYPVYLYSNTKEKVHLMLTALKWGGYLVALYSIVYFGYDGLVHAAKAQANRLDNTFANVNVISMCVVLACIIEFWNLQYSKSRKEIVFLFPCILVLLATQSRKAFVFLFVGIAGIIITKNISNERVISGIIKTIVGFLAVYYILRMASNVEAFQGIVQRLEHMINTFTGSGKTDGSSVQRSEMVGLGIEVFKKHPIGGVGIGCTHYETYNAWRIHAYLHNNFVELLAGGGILGLCSFYWLHCYTIGFLIRNGEKEQGLTSFLFIWIILQLITDYGMVTYYLKSQWLYFAIICAAIKTLKEGDDVDENLEICKKSRSIYIRS